MTSTAPPGTSPSPAPIANGPSRARWRARAPGWIAGAAALGFGALAALSTQRYIADELEAARARQGPRPETVDVVVARRDLERGETVDPSTMAVRALPRDHLPAGVVDPARFEPLQGLRLAAAMRAGEPLLAARVEGADAATFSTRVPDGIRALTIAVDEINAVSGMLQPDDRIDLLLSVRPPAPAPGGLPAPEVTLPFMQDLRVLATGRQVRPAGEGGSEGAAGSARAFTTITVEVTPERAQQLIVAQRGGKLTALLRNPGDRAAVTARPLDIAALLGARPAGPASAPPAGPHWIVGGLGRLAAAPEPAWSAVPVPVTPAMPAMPAMPAGTPGARTEGPKGEGTR